MKEPIHLSKSLSTGKPIVNAEDLHKSLKITKDFRTWIRAKIDKLHLIQDQDFTMVYYDAHGNRTTLINGNTVHRLAYILTLNAAKNISLLYKNVQSNKITQYLIANELKSVTSAEILELEAESVEAEDVPLEYPDLISSREIAEATGKEHKHVIRDIETMCQQAEIVVVQTWTSIDIEMVTVIEHNREVSQGMGRTRKYKIYLLSGMAAEILALGYDAKRRKAMVILMHKMKKALAERPVQTVMLEAKNFGFNEVAKLYGTSGRQINHVLKDAKYIRPNNMPYEKYVLTGIFAWELYDERFSRKRLMLTSTKGMPLMQKLMNSNISLPAVVKEAFPVLQQQASMLPAVVSEWITRVSEQEIAFNAMVNHMMMCKAGKNNPIEEERYTTALQTYHANYLKRNPQ
jgi:phage anti-repressor protein